MSDPANPFAAPATDSTPGFGASPAPPATPPYLLAWFCFFLVATIGGFFIGAGVGAVIGGALGAQGVPIEQIIVYTQIAGFVCSLPISYFAFRWAVGTFIVKKLSR